MAMFQNDKERDLVIQAFEKDIQYPDYLHSIDYSSFNDFARADLARKKSWRERKEEEYLETAEIAFNTEKCIQEKSHSIPEKDIQDSDIQLTFKINTQ
jgi:hypothetical protein